MYRGEANQQFLRAYPRYMAIATFLALVVHAGGAVGTPPYAPSPYQLRDRQIQAVEIPDDIQIAQPPEEIQRPQLPSEVEESEEASEEETIAPTEFDPFQPPELNTGNQQAESFFAFDSPPEPVRTVQPEYPDLARQAEAEGKVWVRMTIDETGRVINAEVERSQVIPSLENAAKAAARKWLFKPAKQRDRPVKCQIIVPFTFSLR